MKKKSEHADKTIRHRSTFAILFYINRTKNAQGRNLSIIVQGKH